MNKAELIDIIATKTEVSKVQAKVMVDVFLETISTSLQKGEEVRLVGFGTFLVSMRQKRLARNPRTGEMMEIPPSKMPKFRAGKELKEQINKE